MNDQGSSYSVLHDIPVMVSPHYRLPKQILIDKELVSIPEETLALGQYTFSVERKAISNVVAIREKQQLEQKARTERLETYKAEKLQQKKVAGRKIAPGFLDTDTRILHPQPFRHSKTLIPDSVGLENNTKRRATVVTGIEEPFKRPSSTSSTPQEQQQQQQQQSHQHYPYQRYRSSSTPATDFVHLRQYEEKHQESHQETTQSPFDYHKFEQGLASLDPWDTPENDMTALRSILGSKEQHEINHRYPQHISNGTSYPQYHHYHPEGPWVQPQYSTSSPPANHSSPYFVPALPPKVYKNNMNTPLPETTSSNARPQMPLPNGYINSSSSGGLTNGPDDVLVQELANMGFSHSQASNALQKNENDLTRATNFLLDN